METSSYAQRVFFIESKRQIRFPVGNKKVGKVYNDDDRELYDHKNTDDILQYTNTLSQREKGQNMNRRKRHQQMQNPIGVQARARNHNRPYKHKLKSTDRIKSTMTWNLQTRHAHFAKRKRPKYQLYIIYLLCVSRQMLLVSICLGSLRNLIY